MKKTKKVFLDKDMARVGIALRRAARQARKIAIQTNTPLVVWENGRVVKKRLSREEGLMKDLGRRCSTPPLSRPSS